MDTLKGSFIANVPITGISKLVLEISNKTLVFSSNPTLLGKPVDIGYLGKWALFRKTWDN